jgi:uroporphyrin-III C-methyltransferase/precorrin-2 dehydrogenase/sirohydrochlorin ferrochelatase
VTPALEALVAPGSLIWIRRRYEPGDLDGAWYAVAATDDPEVNAAVAEEAERARIFCARADDRGASSAWTPAVGRQGDLIVGIHGGGDPQRAIGVRDAVVAGLTDGGIADRARRPTPDRSVGSVVLVGGGPGDPGLITVRGRQAVAQADVVLADHLAPLGLLASLPPEVEVIDASKLPRGRSMAQEQINALLVERALEGKRVVRLKGGDPFVFGRGGEELEYLRDADVPVVAVPGITAALGCAAEAGLPLTFRNEASRLTFITAHRAEDAASIDWTGLGDRQTTAVVYMGLASAAAVRDGLIAAGRDPATPAAVLARGTRPDSQAAVGSLDGLAALAAEVGEGPAILIIGDVVARSTPWRAAQIAASIAREAA